MKGFIKFPSITNLHSEKMINHIILNGFAVKDIEWCVLLKVHGANFSSWMDSEGFRFGRREGFLEERKDGRSPRWNFGGADEVIDKLKQRMPVVYEGGQLVFYGELIGGSYNHPEVERVPNAKRIQKGVDYCPHNDFFLFDITQDGQFQDHDTIVKVGKELGIPYAYYLHRGAFEECIQYSNEFSDPLHKLWGLPEVADNICEGVIVKPVKPLFFSDGSRVILKNKNERFSEKTRTPKPLPICDVPDEYLELTSDLCSLVTENRLRNILSHGIEVKDHKGFGPLLGALVVDVLSEFEVNLDKFEAPIQKVIKKQLQSESSNLIRKHFINILEGEF